MTAGTDSETQQIDPERSRHILVSAFAQMRACLTFLTDHWAKLIAAVVILMAFSPPFYRWSIDRLPSAYYKVGSLGNPPNYLDLVGWNIDYAPIDSGNRIDRIDALINAKDKIARLSDKDAYIPGRGDPRYSQDEAPGKTWEAPSCMLIDEVLFRGMKRLARYSRDGGGAAEMQDGKPVLIYDSLPFDADLSADQPAPITAVTTRELKARYRSSPISVRWLADLHRRLGDKDCLKPDSEALHAELAKLERVGTAMQLRQLPVCPRIEIWFYGSVAPCSIRPF